MPPCPIVCLVAYLCSRLVLGCFQGVFVVSLNGDNGFFGFSGLKFGIDTSLVFCYANRVVQAPDEDFEGDYRCVELFKISAERCFRDVLLENCCTSELPQEPEERLQIETHASHRYLWHSVPSAIHNRSEWWGQL